MTNLLVIAILAVVISISPLAAQIRGAGAATGAPLTGGVMGHGGAGGPGHFHHGRALGSGSILLPYPYSYSDFGYDTPESAPPQVVIVPAAAPAQPAASPAVPLEPLLIEWQGDHFERMTLSSKAAASGQGAPDYSAKSYSENSPISEKSETRLSAVSSQARKGAAQPPRRELPPAVLVFRDGRKEEVSSYTIMSGTIYSNADYWTSGSWTKRIQIADLDVPATLKLNQERGLNFVLPGGPNEVVTRP